MRKQRIILNASKVRKHNNFLKNWAKHTESDNLAEIILSSVIRSKGTKVIVKVGR